MKTKTQPWPYLVKFDYDYYCQGYEKTEGSVLVYAFSFEQACGYITMDKRFINPRNFENFTIGTLPTLE